LHAVTESLTDAWGNPSSSHDAGSILGNFSGLSSRNSRSHNSGKMRELDHLMLLD